MSLRFSPTAWAKLIYFRDCGETEIGGFGITPPDDLLYVQDFQTVQQTVGVASISFDDAAVADFFDHQVDAGLKPAQFGRIWLHTHPGNCAQPSSTDESTFQRVFGTCQHAVMFILAKDGQSYARLRFNVGPGGHVTIPVLIDYNHPFQASSEPSWAQEYKANVSLGLSSAVDLLGQVGEARRAGFLGDLPDELDMAMDVAWMEELQAMSPAERQAVMEDLGQGDPWDDGHLGAYCLLGDRPEGALARRLR